MISTKSYDLLIQSGASWTKSEAFTYYLQWYFRGSHSQNIFLKEILQCRHIQKSKIVI